MRTLIIAGLLALGASAAAAADPVTGTWKTQTGETGGYAHVAMAPCGGKICGKIVKVVGNSNTSIVGKPIIWGMNAKGDGRYSGGKVWAPDQDKTYNSKMSLNGNALKVSGCVLGICRSQTWTRIK